MNPINVDDSPPSRPQPADSTKARVDKSPPQRFEVPAGLSADQFATILAAVSKNGLGRDNRDERRPDLDKGLADEAVLLQPNLWLEAGASPLDVRMALGARFVSPMGAAGWERQLADDLVEILLAWFSGVARGSGDESGDEPRNRSDDDATNTDETIPRTALDWLVRLWALAAGAPAQKVNEAAAAYKGPARHKRYLAMLSLGAAPRAHTTTTKTAQPQQQQQQHAKTQRATAVDEFGVGQKAWAALPREAREAIKAARAAAKPTA